MPISARGGRLMYLGGNGFYWRTAFHDNLPGRDRGAPRRDRHAHLGGPSGRDASQLHRRAGRALAQQRPRARSAWSGVGFASEGFDANSYFLRTPASRDPRAAFIFEGVRPDERIGDFGSLGGAAGFELDIADPSVWAPRPMRWCWPAPSSTAMSMP